MFPTLIPAILSLVSTAVSRIWPDKTEEEKLKLQAQLQELLVQSDLAKQQLVVDAAEAGNPNSLPWRSFVGMSCAFAFTWAYVIQPILVFVGAAVGHQISVPRIDFADMMPVLMAMLGMGGWHMYDKYAGRNS